MSSAASRFCINICRLNTRCFWSKCHAVSTRVYFLYVSKLITKAYKCINTIVVGQVSYSFYIFSNVSSFFLHITVNGKIMGIFSP